MTWVKAGGVALGLMGVILIARPWDTGVGSVDGGGVLAMVVGSLSVGLSFVYARRFLSPLAIAPEALTAYQIGLALVTLTAVTDCDGITDIADDSRALWSMVLGLGLAGTGVAYILYYFIVDTQGAVAASSATYIPPAGALFIGWFFVSEPIGIVDLAGLVLILNGILLLRQQTLRA